MTAPLTVYTRADLERLGMTDATVGRAIAAGRAQRIRPGAYVSAASWKAARIEERQRAAAVAAARASKASVVLAGITAAAWHHLPLFRIRDERVHTMTLGERVAAKNAFVVRHEGALDEEDLDDVDGVLVTSLDRTVYDVIRALPPESGLAAADAALAAVADPENLRQRVSQRIACSPGARGIRRAREIVALADPRSGSPLESGSRWFLHVLGFRHVEIQVPFPGPDGSDYWLDFRFDRGIGEVDGAAKYRDPEFLNGRTPEQALLDEKRREDWIRGRTQEPFVRWMNRDIPHAAALGSRLAAFGIVPPR